MAESRCDHFLCLCVILQVKHLKVSEHFLLRDLRAQQLIDLIRVERHSDRLFLLPVHIHSPADHFSCAHLFHELACAVNGCLCIVRVKPFLELRGGVCPQSNPLAGLADIYSVKACRLKQHGRYVVRDHGILAAHDPRDADLFLAVADHQHILVHGPFLAVKGRESIPVFRRLYNNLPAGNGIQVIGMHRLPVLFHHIVCDIHQVVDRADAHGRKPSLHPFRGWTDLDIFHHSRTVARAEVCIFH